MEKALFSFLAVAEIRLRHFIVLHRFSEVSQRELGNDGA